MKSVTHGVIAGGASEHRQHRASAHGGGAQPAIPTTHGRPQYRLEIQSSILMNHYENVVIDYLRADRAVFVNTECCIQVNPGHNPDKTGPHWYCDAVALDFRAKEIYLCEISYAVGLFDLRKRLRNWHANWEGVLAGLRRECRLDDLASWPVRPWLFVPESSIPLLKKRLSELPQPCKFDAKITGLEEVQPWRFSNFNRNGNCETVDSSIKPG